MGFTSSFFLTKYQLCIIEYSQNWAKSFQAISIKNKRPKLQAKINRIVIIVVEFPNLKRHKKPFEKDR